jgi:DNA integrity scanning protein DisA with diadenylate cyclase activity
MELTHMKNEEHNELKNLLKIPFQKQRSQKRITPIKKNRFMVISNYIFINIVLSNLESIINH